MPSRTRHLVVALLALAAVALAACAPVADGVTADRRRGGTPTTTTTTTLPPPPAPAAGPEFGFAQAGDPLWQSTASLNADFDRIKAAGGRWVRFDFHWPSIQPSGPSTFDWTTTDRAVSAARSRGLEVLAILTYTPPWARPAGTTDQHPPSNPSDYAAFARAAVTRYAPQGVNAWEIWNEPNQNGFWQPKPDVAAYARLLKAVYPAIKAADPGARVITGGLAPAGGTLDYTAPDGSRVSPWRFLKGIYDNGGKGSFDAVGHHPYTGMPFAPSTLEAWNAFQQTRDLHALMTSFGDGAKLVWGTEAGVWTGSSYQAVSEATQAQYVREYVQIWKSWSFVGPFMYFSLRDRGTDPANPEHNFGLLRADRSEKPAMAAYEQALAA